jgi:hypothetical protein
MRKPVFACLILLTALLSACCAPQAPLTNQTTAVMTTAVEAVKAPPQEVAHKTPAPRQGEMSFAAEKVAKEAGCYRSDSATVMAQRTGIQFYRVPCDNGRQLLVRCELRQCRVAD